MTRISSLTRLAAALALTLGAAVPASAATFVFTTSLSSAGEPVATSTATGSATVTFDDVAGTVGVNLSWNGLLGSGPFGHIHCCTAVALTGNATVLQGFNALNNLSTSSYVDTFTPAAGTFTALLAGTGAGKAYVNIHTPGTYASGEIRGFLAPIPEASTYAMMMAGLLAVGAIARRSRQA
jgi:CHRD domain